MTFISQADEIHRSSITSIANHKSVNRSVGSRLRSTPRVSGIGPSYGKSIGREERDSDSYCVFPIPRELTRNRRSMEEFPAYSIIESFGKSTMPKYTISVKLRCVRL